MKEGLPFAQDLSLENSGDSYLCFRLALLDSVLYFFFLYWLPSLLLCTVFDSVSSNIDKFPSINPSTNVFIFGDFNVHHKKWLTCSGWTDRSGECCYTFSISNDLTQMVNFPTWIPDCDSHNPALLDLFISSDASIFLQWLSFYWEILIMFLSQFLFIFHKFTTEYLFWCLFWCIWDSLCDHLMRGYFKLSASAASAFCK